MISRFSSACGNPVKNRLNKTESAVFLFCRLSLFLKDPFFPDYLVFNIEF